MAENEDWKIFLNDEAIGDSIEGVGAVKQVSLWTYNKREKSVKKLLMPHPHADGRKLSMEKSEYTVTSLKLNEMPKAN